MVRRTITPIIRLYRASRQSRRQAPRILGAGKNYRKNKKLPARCRFFIE
jgi:hypothetical protein